MTTQNFELLKKSAVTQIAQDLANQTQAQLDQWNNDKSFTEIGDFTAGFTITARQQIALFNNQWYRWDGALPKIVAPSSTPTGTGGIAPGAWLSVGDAALRSALADPNSTVPVGGEQAKRFYSQLPTLSAMKAIAAPRNQAVYKIAGFDTANDGYGATYVYDAASTVQSNNAEFVRPNHLTESQSGRFVRVSMDKPIAGISKVEALTESVPGNFRVIGQFAGKIWGYQSGNITTLFASTDGARTWSAYCTVPDIQNTVFVEAADGEVLQIGLRDIHKSTGFTSNPAGVSWTKTLDTTGLVPANGTIQGFSFGGNGLKHIVTSYWSDWPGNTAPRLAWVTLNGGASWSIVYNSQTMHGTTEGHAHGVTYDPWDDAFYYIEGHSAAKGVYRSHDNGANWHRITPTVEFDNYPTTIVATENGIVLASDARQQRGLHIIKRPVNRTDWQSMTIEFLWEIQEPALIGLTGIIGFGAEWHRDPRTGVVYIGWRNSETQKPFLTATDGKHSAMLFIEPDDIGAQPNPGIRNFFTYKNELGFTVYDGSGPRVKDYRGTMNYAPDITRLVDKGRLYGGNARVLDFENTNVSVGPNSKTNNRRSVAIGDGAETGVNTAQIHSVAIGYKAKALGDKSVSIGGESTQTTGAGTVAIASNANAGINNVIIGALSSANESGSAVAVGAQSNASGFGHTSVGFQATGQCSTGYQASGQCSFGYQAKSAASLSVAIGSRADASLGSSNVVVGAGAVSSAVAAISMGHLASTTGGSSIAIGASSSSTGFGWVSIGAQALGSCVVGYQASGQCAFGYGAKANASASVAVGQLANASAAPNNVAVGPNSVATAANSTAIGSGANAASGHSRSVALGHNAATQRADTLCIGDRDFESTRTAGRVLLKSPDGTLYAIAVDNGGSITVTAV